ncbi:MAG: hypothetical protein AAB484_01705 [Patescibacteria group bacterium]
MVNRHKLGLVLGGFAGFMHVIWVFFVGVGWAGSILSFIYRIHFIDFSFVITDFSFGKAIVLIVITSFVGYIVGNIVGTIWNFVYKSK